VTPLKFNSIISLRALSCRLTGLAEPGTRRFFSCNLSHRLWAFCWLTTAYILRYYKGQSRTKHEKAVYRHAVVHRGCDGFIWPLVSSLLKFSIRSFSNLNTFVNIHILVSQLIVYVSYICIFICVTLFSV